MTGKPETTNQFSDLVFRDAGRLKMVSELDCREAIVAFMLDWNIFPAEQCAWKMFDRLKLLAREVADVRSNTDV
jgi:hypothetical protein